MVYLLLGLLLFLGVHCVRIFADGWRSRQLAARGEAAYKGLYSLASALGLVLIVWGYGVARAAPVDLWSPPIWTRHLASLLVLASFVLLVAAYVPGNLFKAKLHHPMVLSVKLWAFAHLLSNGRLADVLLFGGFLAWAVLDFRSLRQRDRLQSVVYPAGRMPATVLTLALGVVIWWLFARYLHAWLIGVNPF